MFLNNNEKIILNSYIKSYINSLKMEPKIAKQAAKQNIIKSKERALKANLYYLPHDYWKQIFEMEKNNIENLFTISCKLARNDGAIDEDIIYYWETYPVERFMIQETQGLINMNALITALKQGKSKQESVEIVRKNFPSWGDPRTKLDYGTAQDSYLSPELIFRVNKNVISGANVIALKEELKNFSSFNAFIRYLAREDRLGKL